MDINLSVVYNNMDTNIALDQNRKALTYSKLQYCRQMLHILLKKL